MKVLGNFLLIRPEKEKSKHGLTISGEEQEELERAEVVSIGEEVTIKVKKKDKVLYKNYNLNTVEIDGVKHIFVSADDVLAID